MKHLQKTLALRSVKAANVIFVTGVFAGCWLLRYWPDFRGNITPLERWIPIVIFVFLYALFARIYDAFLISEIRISETVFGQVLSAFLTDILMYGVICLLTSGTPDVVPMLLVLAAQCVLIAVWCVLAHRWYFATFPPKRSAILYGDRYDFEKLIREYGLEKKFKIDLVMPVESCLENPWKLNELEALFLADVPSHERNQILKHCISVGIQAYVLPHIGDVIMSGAVRTHLFHLPILRVGRYAPAPEYLFSKRFFDVVCSAAALLVLSPLLLLIAAAVKLCDGGPVFYRQDRLTKNGKVFHLVKFRSMKTNAEADGIAQLSSGLKDDRVTPIGKVLRRFRLDELPQLWNILMGDMAIVGPRPERPELAEKYERDFPEFRLRLQVKAGLTGYAQVYGKYNSSPYDKLKMDLMYIAHPSFLEDIRICFATIKVLFEPESTEGVAPSEVNSEQQETQELHNSFR